MYVDWIMINDIYTDTVGKSTIISDPATPRVFLQSPPPKMLYRGVNLGTVPNVGSVKAPGAN